MKMPFRVVEVPAFFFVVDAHGEPIAMVCKIETKTDAQMKARGELIAVALNRLSARRLAALL